LTIVGTAIFKVICVCNKCNAEEFLSGEYITKSRCLVFTLWRAIKRVLDGALCAVFINTGENVYLDETQFSLNIAGPVLRSGIRGEEYPCFNSSIFFSTFLNDWLAMVRGSCVCYRKELATLQKSSDHKLSFELTDGMLVFNGRYFRNLYSAAPESPRAKKSIIYSAKEIIPSSIGEHSILTLSIREKLHCLELEATLRGPTRAVRINLRSILQA
jgi:hypothetical protein